MNEPVRYVLTPNKEPIAASLQRFLHAYDSPEWLVGKTRVGEALVRTSFTGIDRRNPRLVSLLPAELVPPLLLFETSVIDGPLDGFSRMYATWAQAEAGHNQIVAAVQEATKTAVEIDLDARD
jgi:hypothetical protein